MNWESFDKETEFPLIFRCICVWSVRTRHTTKYEMAYFRNQYSQWTYDSSKFTFGLCDATQYLLNSWNLNSDFETISKKCIGSYKIATRFNEFPFEKWSNRERMKNEPINNTVGFPHLKENDIFPSACFVWQRPDQKFKFCNLNGSKTKTKTECKWLKNAYVVFH